MLFVGDSTVGVIVGVVVAVVVVAVVVVVIVILCIRRSRRRLATNLKLSFVKYLAYLSQFVGPSLISVTQKVVL